MSEFNARTGEPLSRRYVERRLELAQAITKLKLVHSLVTEDFAKKYMTQSNGSNIFYATTDSFPNGQLVTTVDIDDKTIFSPFIASAVNRPNSGKSYEVSIDWDVDGVETSSVAVLDEMDKASLARRYGLEVGSMDAQQHDMRLHQEYLLSDIEQGARLPADVEAFTRAAQLAYNFVLYRADNV